MTLYERNEEAGRGHEGAPAGTPLVGVGTPVPLRLGRARMGDVLRRRAAEQKAADAAG
ncbi:hypothetical protein ACGFXC_05150 [Streptomyces sp. NPDC048507]|uniref:hypothetical protein n=1 Tax=Streptomyces sp. NPDC048507 TaxID=3365560 RepID=UPI0037233BF9